MRPPARSAHFYWFSSYAQRPSIFGFKLISHVYPAPVTLLILHHEHIYIRLYTSNNDLKSAPPYLSHVYPAPVPRKIIAAGGFPVLFPVFISSRTEHVTSISPVRRNAQSR